MNRLHPRQEEFLRDIYHLIENEGERCYIRDDVPFQFLQGSEFNVVQGTDYGDNWYVDIKETELVRLVLNERKYPNSIRHILNDIKLKYEWTTK